MVRDRVLVAYAGKEGPAREVAEAIAAVLGERSVHVALRPAANVESLAGYGAVVLGGAVHRGRWHHDARRFLRRHEQALAGLPMALYAVGERATQESDGALDRALADAPDVEPVAVGLFATEPAAYRPFRRRPVGGLGDRDRIHRWAADVAREVGV